MALPDRAVISFSDITSTSATVSWRPRDPLEDEKSPITSYGLKIKDAFSGDTLVQQNVTSNTTSYFLTKLDPDTEYSIYVYIRNRFGRGEEQRTDFRTLKTDIPITLSATAQQIINKFENGDYIISAGVNNGIELVKNGSISSQLFVSTFNDLLQNGQIIDKTVSVTPPVVTPPVVTPPVITPPVVTPPIVIPPVVEKTWCIDIYQINQFGGVYPIHKENVKELELLEWEKNTLVKECGDPIPSDQEVKDFYNFADTSINENMVSQSIGAFKLQNGKVTGDIIYIAESEFNPYYYNKPVTSVVHIKDQVGRTLKLKTNNLNFTSTERDETISINEGIEDNIKAVKIEFYVWKGINEPIAFSLQKIDNIVDDKVFPDPCPIGQHRDFNNKCVPDNQTIGGKPSVIGLLGGVTALLGTLALLGSKGR